jgi:hypothetical protein
MNIKSIGVTKNMLANMLTTWQKLLWKSIILNLTKSESKRVTDLRFGANKRHFGNIINTISLIVDAEFQIK